MSSNIILNRFKEIKIETPSDQIIAQIRSLIHNGDLKSGDRLPSERKLSEMFKVGRGYVREAIQKLEFYGIVSTHAQSGTVVAGLGVTALEGLITNVLELHDNDFHSLTETRAIMEINATRMAALRANEKMVDEIEEAHLAFKEKVLTNEQGVEEDLLFHLKIAEASENQVLKSLLLIIIPDMIEFNKDLDICGDGRFVKSLKEHEQILDHIRNKRSVEAGQAMRHHLDYSLSYEEPQNETKNNKKNKANGSNTV